MKRFLLLSFIGLVGLGLASCDNPFNPTVASASNAVLAVNAFGVVEATATQYLTLPLCPGAVVCRTKALSISIAQSVRTGIAARNAIMADLNSNISAPITTIDTLNAAVAALQSLNSQGAIQ